jgi:hypothetical protein
MGQRLSAGKAQPYKPNVVPRHARVWNILIATYLVCWGGFGLYASKVDLWGMRLRIAELQGSPALLMALAFICGALVLIAEVVDHYDKRNNEAAYKGFRRFLVRSGWCMAAASLLSHALLFFAGAHMASK